MKVSFLLSLMILLSCGLALGQHPVIIDSTTYYFDYVRAINIEGDYVQGGPHDEFPVFFDSTVDSGLQDELRTVGNGGEVQSPDGYDIVFADQSGNQYAHEIELYEPSTGKYIAWVKVDLTGNDQIIYIYYGSTDITDEDPDKDTQDVIAVWDSDYVGVWHLNEDPTSGNTVHDSTSYGNNGTTRDDMSAGDLVDTALGKGYYFDGDGDTIRIPGFDPSLDITDSITMQTWVDLDSTDYYHVFFSKGSYSDTYSFFIKINREVGYYLNGICYEWTGDYISWNWQFLAITWNGSRVRTLIDGNEVDSRFRSGTITTNNLALWIGSHDDYDHIWGILDEVRLSQIARSNDWLKTEYNNQKTPGNFYGIEPTLVKLSYFRANPLNGAVFLEWATETELDNAGFNIWRSGEENGEYMRINPYFIPSQGEAGLGAEYSYTDYDVTNGVTYYYKLEDIDINGKSTFHGPVSATPNDIILIWPDEWEILPSGGSIFSWSSSGNYSYKIEISTNPSFPSSVTYSFPKGDWTSGLCLWIRPEQWEIILQKAQATGGQLFWRVCARSEDGSIVYSDRRRLVVGRPKLPIK
jgi:hypothetical protein